MEKGGVRAALGGGWDKCPVERMRPDLGWGQGCEAGDGGGRAEILKEKGGLEKMGLVGSSSQV